MYLQHKLFGLTVCLEASVVTARYVQTAPKSMRVHKNTWV